MSQTTQQKVAAFVGQHDLQTTSAAGNPGRRGLVVRIGRRLLCPYLFG